MSSIKRLIHEIHRRSLWQVLAIYLVGAWLVYQVIGTLWETLHLPEWVPGVAIVLFLIGLPIVLATAFVQEGIGGGARESDAVALPEQEPTSNPRPVHYRVFTWRNALAGGVLAFAALGAVAAGNVVLRSLRGSTDEERVIDANAVAVLPFRVSGSPDLAYLREGMVDLLAAKLTGEGGPRAIDQRTVLRAWRAAAVTEADDLPQDAALGLARSVGAGMLLLGDVVGTPAHVTLNASLYSTQSAAPPTRASVAGPTDSIAALIDRLAAELLSRQAGEDLQRLAMLTSASLPALQAYLAGQVTYRRGHFPAAAGDFRRAVDIDSTFALAGFMLAQAKGWDGYGPDWQRGREIAWLGKDRLSPRDRDIVIAFMGENYPDPTPPRKQLDAWQRLAEREPDLPEVWYGLGDEYFHNGEWLGLQDALERAEAAFQRALAIDSTYAPPLHHMVDLAAYRGDTVAARRLAGRYFGLAPEAREHTVLALLVARKLADSTWIQSLLDGFESLSSHDVNQVLYQTQLAHLPYEDGVRAADVIMRKAAGSPDWGQRQFRVFDFYGNAGQPGRALEIAQSIGRMRADIDFPLFATVDLAIHLDGDQTAAAAAVSELEKRAASNEAERRFGPLLMLALWRVNSGELAAARKALAELRRLPNSTGSGPRPFRELIIATIETRLASAERAPDLAARAMRLDSMLTHGVLAMWPAAVGNLAAAEAFAISGDLQRALAAARRKAPNGMLRPAMLLAEARIAAQLGDRDAAISAYQQYLVLRPHPEPGRPTQQVEAVRRELASLLRERT